ncbi:hypothetical protein BV898_07975 [Hypsibius exemplaris]|uniref:Cilia-and flagella-associated protein 99 n=1 Tax=Hypsibius exemplaris TaxID=2072580 RepID=A0A1W0WS62_HYPEX|nr:hypothetical protein BV898_07975 [Hypsibius exemplaris]
MANILIQVLKLSASILEKFDPTQPSSLPEFIEDFLKEEHQTEPNRTEEHQTVLPSDQRDLILEICTGCLKQHRVLHGIIRPFCGQTKRTILRRDLRLFEVISYFLLFLTNGYSRTVVQTVLARLYSFGVRRFLLFFTGCSQDGEVEREDRPMHSTVRQNWYASFDRAYVEENFYGPYCRYEEELRGIVAAVEATYKNEAQRRPAARGTIVRPFDFKTSERKIASEARLLSRQTPQNEKHHRRPLFEANAIPSTTYAPSEGTVRLLLKAKERTENIQLFKTRVKQRELARQKARLLDGSDGFDGPADLIEKSTHLLAQVRNREMDGMRSPRSPKPKKVPEWKVRKFNPRPPIKPVKQTSAAQVRDREMDDMRSPRSPRSPKPKKAPEWKVRKLNPRPPIKPVKQTTAALLREKALCQRHKDSLQRKSEELSAGFYDPEDYEQRLRRLEARDFETAIVVNERKIIDAMQSLEKAIVAKKAYDDEAKLKALTEKELQKGFREQRRVELEEDISNLRGAVERAQVLTRAQLGEAKRRILLQKQQQALAVKEEHNELQHRYLDQCEEEMARRKAVIAQIQEMEARISAYERAFDFDTVRPYGALTDMSLADLQANLIALRLAVVEQLARKRDRLNDQRALFRQSLEEAREFVARRRPLWAEEKRVSVERARRLKQLRDGVHYLPNVLAVRERMVQQSRERRKQRVMERESLLKIRDSAWERYFYA